MIDRRLNPLFDPVEHIAPVHAKELVCAVCPASVARRFIAAWHSRLPHVQAGPWKLAFVAHYEETAFAAALWHNPSARTLPADWLELRRFAVAPDAPHCTASWMLAQMTRAIRDLDQSVRKLISYQDIEVHSGTIYVAAGWDPAWRTKARVRDRTGLRAGTRRLYRHDANGPEPASSGKIRWEKNI